MQYMNIVCFDNIYILTIGLLENVLLYYHYLACVTIKSKQYKLLQLYPPELSDTSLGCPMGGRLTPESICVNAKKISKKQYIYIN